MSRGILESKSPKCATVSMNSLPGKKKINLRGVDILYEYAERVMKTLKNINDINLTLF